MSADAVFDALSRNSDNRFVLVFSLSLGVITLILGRCFYCVFLHPLRKYPGPFLAKITDAYAAYHSIRGDLHLDMQRSHDLHALGIGRFVRYGPNRLVVNSIQGMHGSSSVIKAGGRGLTFPDIYGDNSSIQKSISYNTMVPFPGANTTATTIDKAQHKLMRRTLAGGFNLKNLVRFEDRIFDAIDKYCEVLLKCPRGADGWTWPLNMDKRNMWLGYDTISLYGFGISSGLLGNPEVRYITDVVKMHTIKLAVYEQWPLLDRLGVGWIVAAVLLICSKPVRDFNKWHAKFMNTAIANNRPEARGIFTPVIQQSQDLNPHGSHTQLQAMTEGSLNVLTSAEIHAGVMTALQFYLAHFPQAHARLRNEIRSTFAYGDDIKTGSDLASCQYLTACIDETLRMRPAGPGALWREVIEEGVAIDGEYIPPGVDIGTCTYTLQKNRRYFRDGHKFWPERWLKGVLPQHELEVAQRAFKPFSLGPRACVGRSAGLHALTISVARMVHQLDFKLAEGHLGHIGEGSSDAPWGRQNPNEFQFKTHFVAMHDGPYLRFKSAYEGSA